MFAPWYEQLPGRFFNTEKQSEDVNFSSSINNRILSCKCRNQVFDRLLREYHMHRHRRGCRDHLARLDRLLR